MINYIEYSAIKTAVEQVLSDEYDETTVCDKYHRCVRYENPYAGFVRVERRGFSGCARTLGEVVLRSTTNDKCRIKFDNGKTYYWYDMIYANNPEHELFGCLIDKTTGKVLVPYVDFRK